MEYKFSEKIWLYSGNGAWRFISLPKNISTEIKQNFGQDSRGWGSIPVNVSIGKSNWKTSIFPDNKTDTYLLPLKLQIRQAENLSEGDKPKTKITLLV